jgi:hypothetical protein
VSDDAALNGPPTPPGEGERRRALQAERDRHVVSPAPEGALPLPPALVRPYARMAGPSASAPAEEPDSGEPSPDDAAGNAGQPGDARQRDADGGRAPEATSGRWDPDVGPGRMLDPRDAKQDAEERPDDLRDPGKDDAAEQETPSAADEDRPSTTPADPPAPPEMAPPGWSAFTPVIPPGPLPFDADSSPSGGWEHVSVRGGDDDSWLRALRSPADPESPPRKPEDHQEAEAAGAAPTGLAREAAGEPAPSVDAEHHPEPTALENTGTVAAEGPSGPSEAPPLASSTAVDPHAGEDGSGPDGVAAGLGPGEGPDDRGREDEEPVRGTLAPVLRRSTERAKYPTNTTPVIRPPVLPTTPREATAPPAPRSRLASWEEALAVDVVPGRAGRRRGRRVAKARHESGGTGEYRPRGAPDRSLTLLVVGMLLVLILLVGVAAWAFWPR